MEEVEPSSTLLHMPVCRGHNDSHIMTPHQLFLFAKADIPSVNFCFATTEECEQEVVLLSSRFESPLTVFGTHKLHCICPISTEQVEVKKILK